MNASEQTARAGAARRARPQRRILSTIVILCVVALVATAAYVVWARAHATQVYGGSITADDLLTQVTMDPSGGVWAIGMRMNAPVAHATKPVSALILHRQDGRWIISKSLDASFGVSIAAIAMPSPDEGWAVGSVGGVNGLILHFQHGSWSELSLHPRGVLDAIAMVSPTEGWAVGGVPGANGTATILQYTHGAWTEIPSPGPGDLTAIAMSSPTAGWAASVATDGSHMSFLRYANGVWTPDSFATNGYINAMAAPAPDQAWAVGQTIYHYSFGAWKAVGGPTGAGISGIVMDTPTDGWAVGDPFGTHTSVLWHYSNGAWTSVDSPTRQPLMSVAMISPRDGWAVGEGGVILHYGGSAWSIVNGAA